MTTYEAICRILSGMGVGHYRVTERREETAELFFVRRRLDMRRITDIHSFCVTVWVDRERDGAKTRGSSTVQISPGMTEEEMSRTLSEAVGAAGFAQNPFYELADPVNAGFVETKSDLSERPTEENARLMAKALFAADTGCDAFVNSAEIFASRDEVRVRTSRGTDVSFRRYGVKGEFVAQCRMDSTDVETYHPFAYRTLDRTALTERVSDALRRVRDRAVATPTLAGGKYDLILDDEQTAIFLSYYLERSDASMIYPGYSSYRVGEKVEKPGDGEPISLSLVATDPFSEDGIPMCDRPLLRDGRLATVHGELRFCRYLGVEPTGSYHAFSSENGSVPMAELTARPYLRVVAFSDFQMDSYTGHFGGEIRLAYLFDGTAVRPVTGGSVNGSIQDCAGKLLFSKERYTDSTYSGPRAVRIPSVPVAGN